MSKSDENKIVDTESYQCKSCGGTLKFNPAGNSLHCSYCGADFAIEHSVAKYIEEQNFDLFSGLSEPPRTRQTKLISCKKCGAESAIDESILSMHCPYCTTPLIESDIHYERLIEPAYLLPFKISDAQVHDCFKQWIKKLWFAPNKLKKIALYSNSCKGMYIPYWTYDAETHTRYRGRRGDHYYVTVGSGDKRRRERRTRWSSASGYVSVSFDDVLVLATKTISNQLMTAFSSGWDTQNLIKTDKRFLSGFVTEKYTVDLNLGFEMAKTKMESSIRSAIKRDIGGDEQEISGMLTNYSNVKFKLILLPLYISSYTYKNRLYHFYVNGRSGKVYGDRPYSAMKIIFFILFCVAVVCLFCLLVSSQ